MRKGNFVFFAVVSLAFAACELGGKFEPPAYTIVYNANGGSGSMNNSSHICGKAKNLNANAFYREGYSFAGGWAGTPDGAVKYADGQSVKNLAKEDGATVTLYAVWSPGVYTVTFDKNGGGTEANPQTKTVTYPATTVGSLPAPPTRANYIFNGWNTQANGTGTAFTAASTVTGNITVYAQWIEGIISATGAELVRVSGGSFQMGKELNPDPGSEYIGVIPTHTVTLSSFYMGRTEVTQSQYQAVMGSNPAISYGGGGVGDNYPVYNVSWYDALVFCNKLSVMEGLTPAYRINNSTNPDDWGTVPTWDDPNKAIWDAVTIVSGSTGYRLPTEAQWEYAAKGGNGSPGNYTYAGSNNPDDVAWYNDNNSPYGSKLVGTKAPNGLGLYDMSGNVYEWCWDWYGSYTSTDKNDPTGASSGSFRVIRGGYWGIWDWYISSVGRLSSDVNYREFPTGFRLARPAN